MSPQMQSLPAVPPDPLDWRPQRPLARRTPREVTNAIIEPLWDGDHVLAHYDSARGGGAGRAWLRLIADDGEDVTDLDRVVTDLLREAIRADDAVIDGFLTPQATRAGESVSLSPSVKPASFSLFRALYSGRSVETDVAPAPLAPHAPVAFVAVDLLRVDGERLFDIPLLERKRVLESIIVQGTRVRVSPYTQPPVGSWLGTWRAAGFRGVVLKAANSRYQPGHETDEWVAALSSRR